MNKHNCKLAALGMVNALGADLPTIRKNLLTEPQSGLSFEAGFIEGKAVPAGMVHSELEEVPEQLAPYRSRNASLLLTAYEQIRTAVEKLIAGHGSSRIGIVIGTSTSGIAEGEFAFERLLESKALPESYMLSQQEPGTAATVLAKYAGITGPCYAVSTACSSSAKVFQSARNLLSLGICDAVITGGADSLCKLTLRGFDALEVVSDSFCNPFSKNRNGINIGEGAALFVLTPESDGIQLLGVGESSDAYHISSPDPSGSGAERAMRAALDEAQLKPNDINYVNLHGTGTKHNDAMESKVVNKVFGAETPCSSTKPFVGHLLGAAGATEIGFCWLMLHSQKGESIQLAPHLWDRVVDPECPDLSFVSSETQASLKSSVYMLSNSFAFGGSNCSVIIGRHSPIPSSADQFS